MNSEGPVWVTEDVENRHKQHERTFSKKTRPEKRWIARGSGGEK